MKIKELTNNKLKESNMIGTKVYNWKVSNGDDVKVEYSIKTKTKLPLEVEPVSVTIWKIGKNFIVDPLSNEEDSFDSRLTVATVADGTIHAMQKGGIRVLTMQEIQDMVKLAKEKSKELRKHL